MVCCYQRTKENRLYGEEVVLARRLRVLASLVVKYNYPSICLSSLHLCSPVYLSIFMFRSATTSQTSYHDEPVLPTLLLIYSHCNHHWFLQPTNQNGTLLILLLGKTCSNNDKFNTREHTHTHKKLNILNRVSFGS